MSGTTRSTNAGMAGVEDTVKDFWATRPRRPRRGRKIAGVAAGIADRYGIDPTLVRIGLVVAAIYGGAGIVVYLAGWLFLPEQDDEVAPFEALIGRGRSSTSSVFTLLLCLAFIPTFSWFFNGFAPGYLSLLVVIGLLYLLHRSRGHLPPRSSETPASDLGMGMPEMPMPTMPMPPTPPTPPVPPTAAMSTGPAAGVTTPLPRETPVEPAAEARPEPEERTTPPAWDPLGAAPFAWDLPDPNPPQDTQEPEPPAPRRKSKVGLVTVGLALITAAALSIVGTPPQYIVGVALAVLGLGMVTGSFVRGGRGLIGLAVPLAVVGLGLTAVAPGGWSGMGDINGEPTKIAQVQPVYARSLGSVNLDLSGLPNSGTVRTRVDLGVGDVDVTLPKNADVQLDCHTDVGSVNCLNQTRDGVDNDRLPTITDNGPDGPGGLKLYLTVDVGTGSMDVNRG